MPVKVRCSSCDKVLTVPDAARGKAVKCPECDTRIPVPAADSGPQKAVKSSGGKASPAKSPKKSPASKTDTPAADESAIMSLDLRRAEDTNARICAKCGFDMQELDEEETECPKCGYDIESGGLGAKARKKRMKGADPNDFYPNLVKSSWAFTLKNQKLAWRTDLYIFICLTLSAFCAFMYLWISAWPPRAFFSLCFAVAFLVIPGWLWVLDTEVIKLTLEKKDKFKRLNFDFFHASASGIMALAWLVVVGGPVLAIPGGLGYYLVYQNGKPEWVLAVCLGIGAIPLLWMLPVGMAHMTMPISTPGWMIWKVAAIWSRCVAGASVWLLWLVLTSIPLIGGAAVIGAVWGHDLQTIVQTMESNAKLKRDIRAAENAPKGGKNAPPPVDIKSLGEPQEVNFKPLIGPGILLAVMCLPIGFIGLFNMRTNGQFTFYFKDHLSLIDKAKDYKYVAKERKSEDDEDKPRTVQQDLTDGIVIAVVCLLLGGIGGMLYGNLTQVGVPNGISQGVFWGSAVGIVAGWFILLGVVFPFKQDVDSRKGFIGGAVSLVVLLVMLGLAMGGVVSLGFIGGDSSAASPDSNQQAQPPADMMPPAGGHASGAPGAAPATAPAAQPAPPAASHAGTAP